jgi:hypothetical protein
MDYKPDETDSLSTLVSCSYICWNILHPTGDGSLQAQSWAVASYNQTVKNISNQSIMYSACVYLLGFNEVES